MTIHCIEISGHAYNRDCSFAKDLLAALRHFRDPNSSLISTLSISNAVDCFIASDLGTIWSYTFDSTTDGLRIGDYGHFELSEDGARRFVCLGHVEELMGVPLSIRNLWSTRDARGIWSEEQVWENDERMRWVSQSFHFCLCAVLCGAHDSGWRNVIVDSHLPSCEFILDEGHPEYPHRTTCMDCSHEMFDSGHSFSVSTFFWDHAETLAEQHNINLYDLVLGTYTSA